MISKYKLYTVYLVLQHYIIYLLVVNMHVF